MKTLIHPLSKAEIEIDDHRVEIFLCQGWEEKPAKTK